MNFHIYRITVEGKDTIAVSKQPKKGNGVECTAIASFEHKGLRDASYQTFKTHAATHPNLYPHHRFLEG